MISRDSPYLPRYALKTWPKAGHAPRANLVELGLQVLGAVIEEALAQNNYRTPVLVRMQEVFTY